MSARLVLLDAATATCAAVTGLGISGYTRPCLHYFPHRLNVLLAGAPRAMTDRLQCLLNAAARLVSDTKFDRTLTQLMPPLARRAGAIEVQTRLWCITVSIRKLDLST